MEHLRFTQHQTEEKKGLQQFSEFRTAAKVGLRSRADAPFKTTASQHLRFLTQRATSRFLSNWPIPPWVRHSQPSKPQSYRPPCRKLMLHRTTPGILAVSDQPRLDEHHENIANRPAEYCKGALPIHFAACT